MPAGTADLHKALINNWIGSGLEGLFKSYWNQSGEGFTAWNEAEAAPNQPWPYCIFMQYPGITNSRMSSASATGRREIREVLIEFSIYAKNLSTTPLSAKEQCSLFLGEILAVYGGHPTIEPQPLCLEYGGVVQLQYLTDEAERQGEEEYSWFVRYVCMLDVPVAA